MCSVLTYTRITETMRSSFGPCTVHREIISRRISQAVWIKTKWCQRNGLKEVHPDRNTMNITMHRRVNRPMSKLKIWFGRSKWSKRSIFLILSIKIFFSVGLLILRHILLAIWYVHADLRHKPTSPCPIHIRPVLVPFWIWHFWQNTHFSCSLHSGWRQSSSNCSSFHSKCWSAWRQYRS